MPEEKENSDLDNIHSPTMSVSSSTFKLSIRQQPERSRMCGFGTKDYRPIDPPPVLQAFLVGESGELTTPPAELVHDLVVRVSLWSPDALTDCNLIPTRQPNRKENSDVNPDHVYTDNLFGSLMSPSLWLNDVEGTKSCFFAFADLSIRTIGTFRLKFSLYNISLSISKPLDTYFSDVIKSYTPITFPGMSESTEITKCLANQGVRIQIRGANDLRRVHATQRTSNAE